MASSYFSAAFRIHPLPCVLLPLHAALPVASMKQREKTECRCGFTYDFLRSDYINIYYEDGNEGGFQIVIDGDTMTVRNEYAWDLVYTRQ